RPRLLMLYCSSHLLASFLAATAAAQSASWQKQAPVPTHKNMLSVAAVSETEVWIAAGALFQQTGEVAHTTDGGSTWERIPVDPTDTLNCIFFLDSRHGWVAGNNNFRTTDGGATWHPGSSMGTVRSLFFVDPLHGWAGGGGSNVFRTVDGGVNWWPVLTPAVHNMRSLWFHDAQNGWAVAINGRVIRTRDGGL